MPTDLKIENQLLRDILRSNLFDGSEEGQVTASISALLTDIVDVIVNLGPRHGLHLVSEDEVYFDDDDADYYRQLQRSGMLRKIVEATLSEWAPGAVGLPKNIDRLISTVLEANGAEVPSLPA